MVGMTTAGDRSSQTEQGGTASLAPLPFCHAEACHAETMTHTEESLESVVANSSTDSSSTDSNMDSSLWQQVVAAIERARVAQVSWNAQPLGKRLGIVRDLRLEIGRHPRPLAETVGREDLAQTLAAEVLPLADACRYLELHASALLRDRVVSTRGRPVWLWGTHVRLRREPFGVVLVIGPANYPLMLPGIQAIQAITAGNVVLIKPGHGGERAARGLVERAERAGLPPGVIQVLPESPQAASFAIQNGVDKVILTGSVGAGQAVSGQTARQGIPAVMELSGCDPLFALDDADPNLVSDCLVFGLTLNQSHTCIAPRRVFASDSMATAILAKLLPKLQTHKPTLDFQRDTAKQPAAVLAQEERIIERIRAATAAGARLLTEAIEVIEGRPRLVRPAVLDGVRPEMEIVLADPFAPVVSFLRVGDPAEAVAAARACPLALGASIFGSPARCQQLADQLDAGVVVINDLIAATADPRVPFGGRRQSGYGVTRGAAGLEEMTQLKAIVSARPWFRPHLQRPTPVDADVLEQLIRIEHAANGLAKLRSSFRMLSKSWAQIQFRKSP